MHEEGAVLGSPEEILVDRFLIVSEGILAVAGAHLWVYSKLGYLFKRGFVKNDEVGKL